MVEFGFTWTETADLTLGEVSVISEVLHERIRQRHQAQRGR